MTKATSLDEFQRLTAALLEMNVKIRQVLAENRAPAPAAVCTVCDAALDSKRHGRCLRSAKRRLAQAVNELSAS